ncbi:MAG TPA: helix-turn-helix domain-containing protein [Steroidobacteraceae bacterium]|jgi:AcrR family transcriptional regulator|nr:helix-turn-helix domain-containing protein [Steroidobacteraceae bacterium]
MAETIEPRADDAGDAVAGNALPGQSRWEARSAVRVLALRRPGVLERSRRIVEAAYSLLTDEGLDGLTIRAVLDRSRLSRRAFYERFADKDDLLLAVFEEVMRITASDYAIQMRKLSDPMDRLRLIVIGVVLGTGSADRPDDPAGSRRAAAMSREHLRLAQARPAELQAALSPLLTLIEQQLADGMRAGTFRHDDARRMAALIYNLVSTTVHTELLTQKTARPDWPRRLQLANDLWEFCRRAVAA